MRLIGRNAAEWIPRKHIVLCTSSAEVAERSHGNTTVLRLHEWKAGRLTFRKGHVKYTDGSNGTSHDSFWLWLYGQLESRKPTWVWATAGMESLQLLGGWSFLDSGELVPSFCTYTANPFILRGRLHGLSLTWLATGNWYNDINGLHFDKHLQRVAQLLQYVHHNNLGQLRPTIGSQAWHSWRHIHEGPFPCVDSHPKIKELERRSYYGGRVECLQPGEYNEPVYQWDIRAAYPSSMGTGVFPTIPEDELDPMGATELEKFTRSGDVIADVLCESKSPDLPVRCNGRLYWCSGRYWTTLAGDELRYHLLAGNVQKSGYSVAYRSADLFSKWTALHFARRKAFAAMNLPDWLAIEKTLGNSLYGYFGRRNPIWTPTKSEPCRMKWGHWYTIGEDDVPKHYRSIGGRVEIEGERTDHKWSAPCVAACITARQRIQFMKYRSMIDQEDLIYTDTDSLHVNSAGNLTLLAATEEDCGAPGHLRKKDIAKSSQYIGPRVYRWNDQWVLAGLCDPHQITPDGLVDYSISGNWADLVSNWNRPTVSRFTRQVQLITHIPQPPPPLARITDLDGRK